MDCHSFRRLEQLDLGSLVEDQYFQTCSDNLDLHVIAVLFHSDASVLGVGLLLGTEFPCHASRCYTSLWTNLMCYVGHGCCRGPPKKKQKNEGESLTSRKPALKRCVNGILLKRSEIVMNDIWHQQKTRSVYCGSVRDPVFRGPPWLEPICRLPRPTNHPTLDSFDLSRLKSIG